MAASSTSMRRLGGLGWAWLSTRQAAASTTRGLARAARLSCAATRPVATTPCVLGENDLVQRASSSRALHTSPASRSADGPTAAATQPLQRFYKKVSIAPCDDGAASGYHVLLDGRRIKTPYGEVLVVPTQGLALAVAAEWDDQGKHVHRHLMHLTALANTAQDLAHRLSSESAIVTTMQFLVTDTLCCREPTQAELQELQRQRWDPLTEWFSGTLGPVTLSDALFMPPHPDETLASAEEWVRGLSPHALAGFQYATETSKSFVVSAALAHGTIDAAEATAACRLETEFQTSRFGVVEWAHTLEEADTKARLAAAALLTQLAE
eukprot:m.158681 g.158681  ORF g.158681 m.158681 type:complete len:323 (+) comp17605_c5_seq1:1744-2712(+)